MGLAADVGDSAVFEPGFGAAGKGAPVAGGIAKRACWATVGVPCPKCLARYGMGTGLGCPVNASMLKFVESAAMRRSPLTRGRFPEPTTGAAGVLILLKNRSLHNEISCCRPDSGSGDRTRHVGGITRWRSGTACYQNSLGKDDEEAKGV
jgi:hypothetical protein